MASDPWSDRKALLQQLERLWQRGELLREALNPSDRFPLRLSLKTPTSRELSERFDAVRRWVASMERLDGFRVVSKSVHHRVIGENRLPSEVWVDSLDDAIKLLRKERELHSFLQLSRESEQRAPDLLDWLKSHPLKALELAAEWSRLLDFLLWRQSHANPGCYLRQISLPGIDSKFIERQRAVLAPLLDLLLPAEQIQSEFSGLKQFARRYGFRDKPQRIRLRLLDPNLAPFAASDYDLSLTANDLQQLFSDPVLRPQRVFITENEINFLSFPEQADSLVLFGAGYGFEALAQVAWLREVELIYWGDIDSHGFAILDQLRHTLPQVQSLLMDEQTLLDHQPFWGEEPKPERKPLALLSDAEQALYQALLSDRYAGRLRLEQERVGFDYLLRVLATLPLSGCP